MRYLLSFFVAYDIVKRRKIIKQDCNGIDKTSLSVFYIQFPWLWGDLLEQGSYLYDIGETIAWKWVTFAVMQRRPAEKYLQAKLGLEPVNCEIVLHTAQASELLTSGRWSNANSVLYTRLSEWGQNTLYKDLIWNVMHWRMWNMRWSFLCLH